MDLRVIADFIFCSPVGIVVVVVDVTFVDSLVVVAIVVAIVIIVVIVVAIVVIVAGLLAALRSRR